ncbi:calcium-binding and coiled-coil domain-containing protein 1b [Scomber japonicus]|uniref:calcium-binding and coiled-coil domain-containing protein 1b n=1 Tax=Scomber japonicus TaxID=13676 RepID=UPI002304FA71|nr:calcium-binding and coiled-coil domain-containing protein 1b [Scomber japonicus]
MDKQPTVVFRNVGQLYFPQTRVECHYSLTSDHQWNSTDWIGIFKVGWSSVKEYYTYTWALVPEGYTEQSDVNCYALFQAFYLPRPSDVEYQFVYVDKRGEVCASSRPFTFCAPKPLDELETMKEDREEEEGEEEEGEEELLLVIPRAQLLQSRLEDCLKEQAELQQAVNVAKNEAEKERENCKKAKMEWEWEREAMKEEFSELRQNLRLQCEMLNNIKGKHEDVKYSQENLNSELTKVLDEKAENQQRIKDLEDNIKVLTDREIEKIDELERLKERLKKMSNQMKHDEEKRKTLQMENEASLSEVRGLQERLEASEHIAESLRRELRELGARQGYTHTELHQARLQVAQLTLQLSEENLVLREERANCALEREAYKHAAEADKKKLQDLSCEVQRKEQWLREERMEREKLEMELGSEKDCNKVLLSDAKRELQEMKASVRKAEKEREEKEREEQQLDKQARICGFEIAHLQSELNYIRHLEQNFGVGPEAKSNGEVPTSISPGYSSEVNEDASPRSVHSPLFLVQLDRDGILAGTHTQSKKDTSASDTQDKKWQHCEPLVRSKDKQLILAELVNPVLSELADSPMW